jgi:selenophosphate synthetase-related protein
MTTSNVLAPQDLEPCDVHAIAQAVRDFAGLRSKAAIGLVSEVFGSSDWLSGPGDDGAAVGFDDSFVVACGEALLPEFVKHDPFGAGIAAVLTNVNDLAAMGARPLGIVDTVVADDDTARQILLGIRHGCELFGVGLLGGHLTRHAGAPSLSAFGVGRAERVLSVTNVAAGQDLVLACATEGEMRTDFPFFRGFDRRGERAAGDIRVLAEIAENGTCVAAKDVSMAGLIDCRSRPRSGSTAGSPVSRASRSSCAVRRTAPRAACVRSPIGTSPPRSSERSTTAGGSRSRPPASRSTSWTCTLTPSPG